MNCNSAFQDFSPDQAAHGPGWPNFQSQAESQLLKLQQLSSLSFVSVQIYYFKKILLQS